jgi:hypothetical protein
MKQAPAPSTSRKAEKQKSRKAEKQKSRKAERTKTTLYIPSSLLQVAYDT